MVWRKMLLIKFKDGYLISEWKNLSSFPLLFALKTPINFMLKRKYGLEKDVKCMTIVGIRL